MVNGVGGGGGQYNLTRYYHPYPSAEPAIAQKYVLPVSNMTSVKCRRGGGRQYDLTRCFYRYSFAGQ